MKKIIFIITPIVLTIITVIVIIFNIPKKINTKIITLDTENHFLFSSEEKENKIFFNIYTNNDNLDLIYPKNINSSFLKENEFSTKLELININFKYSESYFKEKFFCYRFEFKISNLTTDKNIKNAKLELILHNNKKYLFNLGTVDILFIDDSYEKITSFIELKNTKTAENIIPRVKNIILELDKEYEEVNEIFYGSKFAKTSFERINNRYTINLPEKKMLLSSFPLVFVSKTNRKYYFSNFNYFESFNNLETFNRNEGQIYEYGEK